MGDNWEELITPVVEADKQMDQEIQPPLSDAYMSAMSPKRRRRVVEARPPQEAAAFINDCMSAATEGAVEGVNTEQSLFEAFLESFRRLTRDRVHDAEDYRPSYHTAVEKLLNLGPIQEEPIAIYDQQPDMD